MSTGFTYKVYIPSHSKYYRFRTFNNDFYLSLGKQIQNNDDVRVREILFSLISDTCDDKINVDSLTRVDLFVTLLTIRIMSVSDIFQFETTVQHEQEKLKHKITLDLYDILNDVTNHELNKKTTVEFDHGYKMTYGIPKCLVSDDHDSIIVDILDRLTIGKQSYDLHTLTHDQKKKLLDELPGDTFTSIINHIRMMDTKYRIKLFHKQQMNIQDDIASIELKLFDNSFFEFIKLMYNCNLEEQYYIRYILSKQIGFTLTEIEGITPNETQTYINMYRKEIEEQQKSQEKSTGSKSSMSLPDPGFVSPQ